MTELPRKAAVRTARLAALPLGYAGRSALGFGKRLGGKPAEAVLTEVQQRTAEQLFRTLGELKGGAMKFGQALSVLEAALPDELVAPYREHLTALQDSAPAMPAAMAYEEIEDALGPDWRDQLVEMDETAAAAASIGQVHRGRWHDGREVAIKVQYPGAADALLGDLRQIARVAKGMAPVFPGIDIKPLVEEVQARAADELDYRLEAEAQAAFAEAFRGDPEIVVPDVVAFGERVLVSEWMESPSRWRRSSATAPGRSATTTASSWCASCSPARRAPGCCTPTRTPATSASCRTPTARPASSACSTTAPSRASPSGRCPAAMGRLMRLTFDADPDALLDGLRREGFVKDNIRVDPQDVFDYLAPFVEPTRVERFRFSREWMREQFDRVNNPRSPSYTVTTKINLPPAYLLIHRTWLGGIGLLSQLEAEAPFRAILEESLPGVRALTDPIRQRCYRVNLPLSVADESVWTGSAADPEAAAAEPVPVVAVARGVRGAARAEVGADDRGAQVVELGRDDPAVDAPGHRVDEAGETRVVAEAEERRLGAEAAGVVELADGVRDGERVGRVVEVDLAARLEVGRRLAVGDDQQHRLGVGVLAEVPVGEQQRRGAGSCPCPTGRRGR